MEVHLGDPAVLAGFVAGTIGLTRTGLETVSSCVYAGVDSHHAAMIVNARNSVGCQRVRQVDIHRLPVALAAQEAMVRRGSAI